MEQGFLPLRDVNAWVNGTHTACSREGPYFYTRLCVSNVHVIVPLLPGFILDGKWSNADDANNPDWRYMVRDAADFNELIGPPPSIILDWEPNFMQPAPSTGYGPQHSALLATYVGDGDARRNADNYVW